jgi:hypothetical protein
MSDREFDVLTAQHLANILEAVRAADVFIFTLGLTEAWVSNLDGAVFPACPGTVAGDFDRARHVFKNFSASEVTQDLQELIDLLRLVHPGIRIVLTVSPVPLVATGTDQHVLVATIYSKSVLRVAAGESATINPDVTYFPAYEIVTGPQAPFDFFEPDRRQPSTAAIGAVMRAFLSQCETDRDRNVGDSLPVEFADHPSDKKSEGSPASEEFASQMSAIIATAQCEEEAAGL